jgi:hypothetical protein
MYLSSIVIRRKKRRRGKTRRAKHVAAAQPRNYAEGMQLGRRPMSAAPARGPLRPRPLVGTASGGLREWVNKGIMILLPETGLCVWP